MGKRDPILGLTIFVCAIAGWLCVLAVKAAVIIALIKIAFRELF